MEAIVLHELEVTGVVHQPADRALVFLGKEDSGIHTQIIFREVEWWELCSFGIQNVLFRLERYSGTSLTDALILEHDIPVHYSQSVRAGQHTLFVLNEQVGLSGWVIAADVNVDDVDTTNTRARLNRDPT